MSLLNGEWRCEDCGTDLNTDRGHAAFHRLCWHCFDARQGESWDSAAEHYAQADLWCMGHVNDDTAQVAMVNTWLAIVDHLGEIRAQLARIAERLEHM